MTKSKLPLSEQRAIKKYKRNHRKQTRIISYRSTARVFFRRYASLKDINEFKHIIQNREKYLKGRDKHEA